MFCVRFSFSFCLFPTIIHFFKIIIVLLRSSFNLILGRFDVDVVADFPRGGRHNPNTNTFLMGMEHWLSAVVETHPELIPPATASHSPSLARARRPSTLTEVTSEVTTGSLVLEFAKLLSEIWNGREGTTTAADSSHSNRGSSSSSRTVAIAPKVFLQTVWNQVPRFRGYQPQDAHEFLMYLLERVANELDAFSPLLSLNSDLAVAAESILPALPSGCQEPALQFHRLLEGTMLSEVACMTCSFVSTTSETFNCLSLDLPPPSPVPGTPGGKSKGPLDLRALLGTFTEAERLQSGEWYLCERCKKRQPTLKKFTLQKVPSVLLLHIKRFRWEEATRAKVSTPVKFPLLSLDMKPFVLSSSSPVKRGRRMISSLADSMGGHSSVTYDLSGLVCHHGTGTSSGHFTAYCWHDGREEWQHYNDSNVHAVEASTVAAAEPYLLMYRRRSAEPLEKVSRKRKSGR